jgi:preprotein translocase subunit SecF
MEKVKNSKIIYLVAVLIIIIGIIVTCISKTNFSLEYSEHTRIDIYIGKEFNIDDIKQITKEVFKNKEIKYQNIETFNDSIAINVKELNDEELTVLKDKVKEKYEIEEIDSNVTTMIIPHYRIRDIIKPYIIPMVITTIIILVYVGIRYLKLGVFNVIITLLVRLIISEAVLASIIQILRIPVGVYMVPVAILIYILIIMATVVGYENEATRKKQQEEKK